MLKPQYLASLPDEIVHLYAQLENDILTDMARRLSKLDKVEDYSLWQAKIFQEVGGLQEDVAKYLEKYNKKAETQLANLFDEAMAKSAKNDVAAINRASGLSDSQEQILNATVKKTASSGIVGGSKKVAQEATNGFIKVFSGIERLTMTIASSASADFVAKANQAYMQVSSGAFDYKTALKHGVDDLASKGVTMVEYTDSGKTINRSIEGALRANILTGINQTASTITLDNCNDLDCDLVEVSAHLGARPEHASWQGKIYSLSGTSKKYPSFTEVCRPGTPDGICGVNCRHSYYPYFEGAEPHYTDDELDEYEDEKVTYNGKEMTRYEGEQKQREIERTIRKYKRMADSEKIAGLDDTHYRQKVGQWQATARDFTKQTRLVRDYSREYVGTSSKTQPRALKPLEKEKGIFNKKDSKKTPLVQQSSINNFKKIEGEHTIEQDAKATNPSYSTGAKEWTNNCQRCVSAYEARRRGFDVKARPILDTENDVLQSMFHSQGWLSVYKDPKPILCKGRDTKVARDIAGHMKKWKDGARAIVRVQWKGRDKEGHVFMAEQFNGRTYFYDPQNGKPVPLNTFLFVKQSKTYVIRVDNLEFTDKINECVE